MATLQPYQRTLLENRDSLLTEVRTDQVVPLLFVSHVLNQKEIDNIDVGRTWNERAESLLDVLHYKGERGFREFCNALEDTYPHLATKLKASRPQVEVSEGDSRQGYSEERHVYSVPHKERTRSSEQFGGEFEKRQERESDAGSTSRSQRESQEMRGDQSYERKPHRGSRENMHRYYDGGRFEDRGQYGGNLNLAQVEHDRSSQGSSERGFRRSATDLDMQQPGPGEQEIMEKQTIVLEKAHAGQGFGIAVSGGKDNPHKLTGDPAIIVSDIISNSPAAGLLRTGDIICQVNDRDVVNVMHSTAVQALKDSGNSARLIIKRRKIVSIPKKDSTPLKKEPQQITLIRDKVKGYGFSLGHQLFIKEIDEKGVAANDGGIRSGDVLMKINDKRTDELTLRSAIDLVRNSKDRLDLVVLKQDGGGPAHFSTHSLPTSYLPKEKPQAIHNGYDDERVPDIPDRFYDHEDAKPARPPPPDEESEKGMPFLDSSWKRPGPPSEPYDRQVQEEPLQVHVPADVTHSAPVSEGWDHSSPITKMTTTYVESGPSTPRGSTDGRKSIPYRGDARLVTFRKSGSLGIQVQGGNKVGIFVAAVKEGSAAHDKGLRKGDQILMANDIDFKDITREEAVLILLSLGDEVSLLAQHKRAAFDKISKEPGDDFYIKAHFNYEAPASKPEELTFNKEDVFHVTDTMFNGVIGSWHAKLVDKMMNVETESGVVPNKCRAEQLAVVEQKKEEKTPQKFSTGSLKRSSFKGGSLRKNYQFRSTDRLDMAAFDSTVREIQLPAYERVQRKHPGFVRPVVLLGPIADITRDKLLQDMPDVYAVPGGYQYSSGKSQKRSYNYRDIREIIDSGKHCLLDISPDEVERLNYAQLYPIVIFLKPPSKQMVKEMRAQYGQSNKHIKQLYDNAMKLEEFYYNVFHAKITAAVMDNWYGRVKEEISKQQQDLVWMTEDKVEDDEHEDMVFHGPGRYSQAFDNDSTHYDSNLDSPTIRSSVSTQPVDEDIVHVAEPVRTVQSAAPPRDERNMHQAYSEPYISYNGQDADRYDDRRRDYYDDRFDRDRDRYDGRPPYDVDDDIEKASRPGYKPSGNIVSGRKEQFPDTAVQVLPSSEKPTDLRQSLRKSLPPRDSGEWDSQYETEINRTAEGLRRSEPLHRLDQPSDLEAQVRNKRDALRKVEDDSDLLRQYDERVGVKVSDLWTIDNESRGGRYDRREPTRRPDDEPAVSVAVKSSKPDDDLDKRLEQLEEVARQPPMTKPKPTTFRNTIVDYRSEDRPERVAHTTRYPVKSYAVKDFTRDEPEVRVQTSAPVSSMPRYQDDRREYPGDQVIRVGEPEAKFGSRPSEPRQTYRAEVTIPTRRDSKPERPRSGYSSHAYAPKPFAPSEVQVGQTYDFKLSRPQTDSSYSSLKRDEDRYGYGGMTDLDKVDHGKDDQQNVVTSDFESLGDETQVVATARGRFTSKGGVLSSPESGVSIVIPEGAIPKGLEQEIYFKVCKDNNFMPPLDADKGETLLSPLVMCGPHGTQFLKPVELRLPHCASMTPDGWSFALKSSDTPSGDPFSNPGSPPSQWKNLSLQGQDPKLDQCKVDSSSVSVLVDHF